MESDLPDPLLSPFGADQWSRDELSVTRDAGGRLSVASPFPCAVIEPASGEPLRLNNSHYALAFKPAEEADPDLVANLRDCIKLECGPWNRKALDFVDLYIAAIERFTVVEERTIATQAIGFGRLFDRHDWIFSALRPLPRAHLPIGDKHFRVTFAFWTGTRLLAVDLDAGDLMPGAARERESLFRAAGIACVSTMPTTDAGWRDFLAELSPAGGLWQGETLPLGPFRSAALDAPFDQ
jgi:hypothetical protein